MFYFIMFHFIPQYLSVYFLTHTHTHIIFCICFGHFIVVMFCKQWNLIWSEAFALLFRIGKWFLVPMVWLYLFWGYTLWLSQLLTCTFLVRNRFYFRVVWNPHCSLSASLRKLYDKLPLLRWWWHVTGLSTLFNIDWAHRGMRPVSQWRKI